MKPNSTTAEISTKKPLKQYFHCRSCGHDRLIKQLGKITKGNNSKRRQFCCDKANAATLKLQGDKS